MPPLQAYMSKHVHVSTIPDPTQPTGYLCRPVRLLVSSCAAPPVGSAAHEPTAASSANLPASFVACHHDCSSTGLFLLAGRRQRRQRCANIGSASEPSLARRQQRRLLFRAGPHGSRRSGAHDLQLHAACLRRRCAVVAACRGGVATIAAGACLHSTCGLGRQRCPGCHGCHGCLPLASLTQAVHLLVMLPSSPPSSMLPSMWMPPSGSGRSTGRGDAVGAPPPRPRPRPPPRCFLGGRSRGLSDCCCIAAECAGAE